MLLTPLMQGVYAFFGCLIFYMNFRKRYRSINILEVWGVKFIPIR